MSTIGKKRLSKINNVLCAYGIDLITFIHSVRGTNSYIKDYFHFKKQLKRNNKSVKVNFYPCMADRYDFAGTAKGHYFHQDLLVAQKVFINNPKKHVDIGSRIDGFVAHVASYREIEVLDIRPISDSFNKNVKFRCVDLMDDNLDLINYCDSLSCLHAMEHFGLGRYGDNIDYFGYIKGFNNMYKILQKEGILYLSVPIGPQRIEFNAHRVFSVSTLLSLIKGKFEIISFSYVNDHGDLVTNPEFNKNNIDTNFGCNYGCGIFELRKL